jgi:muconolactone delta-isomerase
MAKFLVLARPAKPLPEGANIKRAVEHLQRLQESGRAEVYTLIEDDGYGFAFLIDVGDHDELMAILFENPLGRWGEFQVMPLGALEGERRAMENVGIL